MGPCTQAGPRDAEGQAGSSSWMQGRVMTSPVSGEDSQIGRSPVVRSNWGRVGWGKERIRLWGISECQ